MTGGTEQVKYTEQLSAEGAANTVELLSDPEQPHTIANLRVAGVEDAYSWMIADLDKITALQLISGLLKFIGSIGETVDKATDEQLEQV